MTKDDLNLDALRKYFMLVEGAPPGPELSAEDLKLHVEQKLESMLKTFLVDHQTGLTETYPLWTLLRWLVGLEPSRLLALSAAHELLRAFFQEAEKQGLLRRAGPQLLDPN